jgi:AraC-like DNA-binding protein
LAKATIGGQIAPSNEACATWLERSLEAPPAAFFVRDVPRRAGQTPRYNVRRHWAVNLYECRGHIEWLDSGTLLAFEEDSVCLLPPGVWRRFHFREPCRHRIVAFAPGRDVEATSHDAALVLRSPHLRDLEVQFADLFALHHSGRRARTQSALWRFLWSVVDVLRERAHEGTTHPAVRRAVAFVQSTIYRRASAAEIAGAAGLSYNQLNRLFREHFGSSLIQYLLSRRMEEAAHLLDTTDLPVKAIAAQLGALNLQQFNKQFRRYYRRSPRRYRRSGDAGQSPRGAGSTTGI